MWHRTTRIATYPRRTCWRPTNDSLRKEGNMEGEPTTKRELIEELIADADGVDGVAIVDALALSVSELIRTIPVMAEVIEAARALLDSEERFGQPAIALQDALDRLDAPLSQDFINAANAIADADEAPIANWS